MSYSEKKITQAEIDARNVKSAPDVLVGNAGDNKQVFDNLPEYIAEKYNSLMDDLDGTQGDIDADISSIGSEIDAINETLGTKADNVDFAGATATEASEHGLVPPLAAGKQKHVLFGSGQWHQLDIDAWQNNSSVNVGLTTDKSAGGTYIRYSTASIPVATPTQPGAMSATDKSKLDNIAEGAEVNVQPDWNDTDTSSDAYIKNKPTIDATLDPDSANAVQNRAIVRALDQKADDEYTQQQFTLISGYLNGKVDKVSGKGLSTNDYTTADKTKLAGIATGAEVNVQSDWNQTNTSADDYVKNKPTIVTPADLNTAINAEKTAREQADSEIETIALNAYINKTASGAIATFADGSDAPMKSCIATIEPQQSGSGTPSPENVRPISGWESVEASVVGKNKLNNNSATATSNGVTFTKNDDGTVTANGTASGTAVFRIYTANSPLPNADVILNGCPSGGQITVGYSMIIANSSGTNIGSGVDIGNGTTYTSAQLANANQVQIIVRNGTTVNNLVFKPMIRLASETDSSFEPYQGTTTTTSLGRTVYGGTVDVVTGVLTAYPFYPSYNGETLGGRWICDRAVYAEGTTPPTGSQVALISGTGTTYQLTPTEVKTLLGENNVWADSGDVEVVYRADPTLAYQELANAITALGGNV